jgi:hypothetical protein
MKTDRKLNTADLASFHHFLHLNLLFCYLYLVDKVRFQPGFRIRIFFCGSGSGQKSSFGSGSWGYPVEGAGGKGKKWFFFLSFFHVSDDS